MSELTSTDRGSVYGRASDGWREQNVPARREHPSGVSRGWLVAGVAALALGYLAWRHFGPDLRRYIKMERM
jgi:hypothetical protein